MKFITSISPRRIERQQYCMATWLQFGEITAVQTASEIPLLQPLFPNVQFVATEKTGAGGGDQRRDWTVARQTGQT